MILIRTTYKDNYWVVGHPALKNVGYYDNHVIADFEHDELHDQNNYNVYALGLWGTKSEGLIWKYVKDFKALKKRENKIYYSYYKELPQQEFFTIYGLDYGGGGGQQSDECDGKSKTVLKKYHINKNTNEVYHELLLYRGFISNEELIEFIKNNCGQDLILSDNARNDKNTELQNAFINVLGAKTKEGKSSGVVSGMEILASYKHFIKENSKSEVKERKSHKWEVNPRTDQPTGKPEDKYKDITDTDRYAIVYYHLNYNY